MVNGQISTGQGHRAWPRRLAGYCLRHRRSAWVAVAAALGGTAVGVLVPLVTKVIIDDVIMRSARPLPLWIAVLCAVAAAGYLLGFLQRWHAGRLAADVQHDLRTDLFRSLVRLDGARQDELRTGQLLGRATSDLSMVFGLVSTAPAALAGAATVAASLVVMAVLSPLLTLVVLLIVPALWGIALRSRTRLFPAAWAAQNQAANVAGVVQESLAGIQVVKGFGQERQEMAKLSAAAGTLYTDRLRTVRLTARYGPALQAVPSLGQVGILALGGWMVIRGQLTLGTFVAFYSYLVQLIAPTRLMVTMLTLGQQAGAGVGRVLELIDLRPTLTQGTVRLPPGTTPGITFDRVTFGYDPGRPVLKDFSLSIAAGETVAVVGFPGSGKSTLALLVARFYDVSQGSVRVGGVDVRDLTFDSLRSVIGIVPEETFLFSGTVGANIAYGRPGAGDEQIRAAARIACAEEFITALPEGYATVIGNRGHTLSGGQRQRIALARALLTEPRLLILDDATSAVDARVEASIQEALREVIKGRTTLIVARRRSTLALADRVAVLDQGRLVDVGTHEELLRRCARYRDILQSQGTARNPERPVSAAPSWEPCLTTTVPADLGGAPGVGEETLCKSGEPLGLRHLMRGVRLPLAAGMSLIMADAVVGLSLPLATRHGLENALEHLAQDAVWAASCLALLLVLLQWAAQSGAIRVTGRTGERLLYRLRVQIFAHLHRLGLDHHEQSPPGRTLTPMTTDVDSLASFLQTGLVNLLVSLLTLAGVLVALLFVDPWALLAVLAVLPAFVAATMVFRRKAVRAYTQAREQIAVVNGAFQELAGGVRLMQAFRREADSLGRFTESSDAYRRAWTRGQLLAALYSPFIQFLATGAATLVLAVGAIRVDTTAMTIGTLVACLLYIELFFAPVQQLTQLFDGYQRARVSLGRIQDLLRVPPSTPEPSRPRKVASLRGEIAFTDVHFRYGDGAAVLTGVDLHIPPGQTVAFVGRTGAGKSTLVKLVSRYYDPTRGAVLIDGMDLRSLDLTAFRQRLGIVPQEPYLFSGTVRDAIAYGRMDATDAMVEAAARKVGAHEVIAELANGYRYRIVEGGRNLSAGQRQLIALARAELIQPDVLLLDEATSALDPALEELVNQAVMRLSASRTTLIVTHRLAMAARADRIIVLDGGSVREDGSHPELLALGGLYARLWHTSGNGPTTAFSGTHALSPSEARSGSPLPSHALRAEPAGDTASSPARYATSTSGETTIGHDE